MSMELIRRNSSRHDTGGAVTQQCPKHFTEIKENIVNPLLLPI